MKRRPIPLIILILGLVGVAFSMPIQIMLIYEHPISEWYEIYLKLTNLNLIVMFLCLVNAALIFKGLKYSLYLTPILIALTVWNNYWAGHMATDFSMGQTLMASLLFTGLNGLIYLPVSIRVLSNSKAQWWRVAPRKQVEIPILVSPWLDKDTFTTNTFDISESGAFLRLNQNGKARIPDNLNAEDNVEIRFQIGGFYQIRCSAKVVRVDKGKGSYPPGMGIQFGEMNAEDKKVLHRFLKGDLSL